MFTPSMYNRLSEWLSNLSLLFLAVLVFPALSSQVDRITIFNLVLGVGLSFVCLWFSLRFSRLSGR
ncbi:MAG: hypothetical protein US60_C0027G0014 [Microgenomates group bacterium GW2011_GWC1_37_8]|nr:MAG: hypothetical protein US60_C0027G0014 [Microgenomates group bacterium GW2011_GWC1_37_8]